MFQGNPRQVFAVKRNVPKQTRSVINFANYNSALKIENKDRIHATIP